MDEFLSLCAADEQDATDGESFVTASSEITVDRTVNSTDMDSFLSAKSVLPSETDDDYSANISNEPSHHDQTITNDIIQSQIDELDRKRREVINLARATVFGSGSTENRKDSRLKSGPKLVDLDFSQPYINSEPATSKQFSANSDSSDDEMMGRKKPLTESGKLLKKQLAKVEEIREFSRDVPVPSMVFIPDSWTTAGVVVNRDVRKSVNGKDYLIWKLHDLKDCQDPPVTLLLFGEACKEFWKLQVGICVALMTPQIADNDQNSCVRGEAKFKPRNTLITLKVFKSIQVVELGFSSDLGTCKGVKLDGQKCSNFVNISLSEFCVHHVMKEARKLSAKRG
ncbi:unnamed protein product [Angiostrongylus costaricensis]|uniref:Zf-primase domain-containing protein n=1 Tax=Angiostrongylus costaricensis TaxID=334426 RepID=A0A0R3PIW5_ANGCS|nr:unnamed protein product [Angiostrongylus costaricensis]